MAGDVVFRAESYRLLRGEALARALRDAESPGPTLDYREARRVMFGELFNEDGFVIEVYTGRTLRTLGIPDVNGPNGANTEHVTPRSWGVRGTRYESSLHNLLPTDTDANAVRGNAPFGRVETVDWAEGGSRRGNDAQGNLVFQPRDDIRGDIARMRFWVENERGGSIDSDELEVLRAWADEDPVSDAERARHEIAARIEGERNYFVDLADTFDRRSDPEDYLFDWAA